LATSIILIVDDEAQSVAALKRMLPESFFVVAAEDGVQALKISVQEPQPDVILLDVGMPNLDGYQVLERLKSDPRTRSIPVILVTGRTSAEDEAKGFALGAVDYIAKPVSHAVVKARIRTQLDLKRHRDKLESLVAKRTREIKDTQIQIVLRLARAAEYRDNETGAHVRRISHYCRILARTAGLPIEECDLIFHASSLHDVGKIGIPDRILLKPGKLDPEEWRVMQTHARIGAEILGGDPSPLLVLASEIASTHHERWDGLGYPRGLREDAIPVEGRIVAICDVFDALTSDRPYKKAWSVEDAAAEIRNQRGKQFDPELADSFARCLPELREVGARFTD
jgi:putative two-component system response regulator